MTVRPNKSDWSSMRRPDSLDTVLCILYLLGIYLGIALPMPGGFPLPAVISGVAGLLLLTKNAGDLRISYAVSVVVALGIAALSILSSNDVALLPEKFKGLVQLSYSILIAFGFAFVARRFTRDACARILLVFVTVILVGSVLETFSPTVKAASDAFRAVFFDSGVYAADQRDLTLYGRIRPKFFTSEPSFIAFGYTLFAFCWYVLSRLPGKVIFYVGLLTVGYFVIRGPTILLGLILIPIYEVFLGSRRGQAGRRHLDVAHALFAAAATLILVSIGAALGWEVLSARIDGIASGRDPSFFARIVAPALVAREVLAQHPFAGVGLTGWEALEPTIVQLYATTEFLSFDIQFDGPSKSLTNYFWSLWIFMGLAWGGAFVVAISALLRGLGAPSLIFCWGAWTVFGQAAGGFVTPRTWSVLALTVVIAVLHERTASARSGARAHRPIVAEPYFAQSAEMSRIPAVGLGRS